MTRSYETSMTPAERTLKAKAAAHQSWANTPDRTRRTAKARGAFDDKFLAEAEGDPIRAAHLRKAYFANLAAKSAKARRRRREIDEKKNRRESNDALALVNWAIG